MVTAELKNQIAKYSEWLIEQIGKADFQTINLTLDIHAGQIATEAMGATIKNKIKAKS